MRHGLGDDGLVCKLQPLHVAHLVDASCTGFVLNNPGVVGKAEREVAGGTTPYGRIGAGAAVDDVVERCAVQIDDCASICCSRACSRPRPPSHHRRPETLPMLLPAQPVPAS